VLLSLLGCATGAGDVVWLAYYRPWLPSLAPK
jgi:hypothetical protein